MIWHPDTGDIVPCNPYGGDGRSHCAGCGMAARILSRGNSTWRRGQCLGCQALDKHIAEHEPAEAFRSSVALYIAGAL